MIVRTARSLSQIGVEATNMRGVTTVIPRMSSAAAPAVSSSFVIPGASTMATVNRISSTVESTMMKSILTSITFGNVSRRAGRLERNTTISDLFGSRPFPSGLPSDDGAEQKSTKSSSPRLLNVVNRNVFASSFIRPSGSHHISGQLMMASHLAATSPPSSLSHRRFMSTSSAGKSSTAVDGRDGASQSNNFEDTMEQLFQQNNQQQIAPTSEADQWFLDQVVAAEPWDPKWWNVADQAIHIVNFCHDMTGFNYAVSIMATTCVLRLCILPLAIKGQRNASRMAHLQPELELMRKRYEALGTPSRQEQQAFGQQTQALFKRFDVNPLVSMGAALVQVPAFVGMFFGLKKMPDLFPDQLSTGGMLWFTDLTVPDPLFILPAICGLTFLATIELGKDQMIDANPAHGQTMIMAFRAMAVVMVPAIMYFPTSVLCYWVPNNFLTMVQSIVLRNDKVKKTFGIWERPKPVPGSQSDMGFQETMTKLVKQVKGEPTTEKEKIQKHNKEVLVKKRVQSMSKNARNTR